MSKNTKPDKEIERMSKDVEAGKKDKEDASK